MAQPKVTRKDIIAFAHQINDATVHPPVDAADRNKLVATNATTGAIELITKDSVGGAGGDLLVYKEVPTGLVDGVNTQYVLSHQPNDISLIFLFVNGVFRQDFTYDHPTQTITIGFAPSITSEVFVHYFVAGSIIVGTNGLSAYEVALLNGFIGTEAEWLDSLVGPPGEDGDPGPQGPPGGTGSIGPIGPQGEDGLSAYEVAVANGFVGTESEWLISLTGDSITVEILEGINEKLDMLIDGRFYVPETFTWTSSLAAYADKTMVITYDHIIASGHINLPANCILRFEGGSITSSGNLVGNNSRIINEDGLPCFNTTINFTGTWSETVCTYQWFGARSVPTRTSYINECSAAINKQHISPFKVEPLPGFYYITSTLIFSTPKTIDFGISPYEHEDDNNSAPDSAIIPNHVRFITNVDIDMWDLRISGLHLIGGTLDVRGVGTYTKDVIKLRTQTAKIISGTLYKTKIIGSMVGNSALGASGKGFHFDMSGNTLYGCMANMDIDILILFIPYGIYIDDPSTGHADTWNGVNTIKCLADGCKQGFHVEGGFHNTYIGYTQSRNVLAYTEQDMYQAEFSGSNILDMYAWDLHLRDSLEAGFYYPSRGILIDGDDTTLIGASLKAQIAYSKEYYGPKPAKQVTVKSDISILGEKLNKKVFISELHNLLLALNKTNPAVIRYHSGATIDFDAIVPVINSEPIITNIVGTYTDSLFSGKGYAPTFAHNGSTDPDKDFVEISFNGISYYGMPIFHLLLEGYREMFKRIQLIGFKSAGNPDVVNIYPVADSTTYSRKTYKGTLPTNSYTSFAIRLIGSANIRKVATISEATPGVVTCATHGMSGIIQFGTTGTLPAPLLVNTNYYIVNSTTNNFNVSLTSGGAAIDTTTTGSGTHYISKVTSAYINDIALESTGNVAGPNFVFKVDDFRYKYVALISQTGTNAPTIVQKLNTTGVVPTFNAYSVPGDFTFNCANRVTTKNDILDITLSIYQGLTFIGTVWITRTNDSAYRIRTYNPAGILANGILTNFLFMFNTAW